MVNFIKDQEVQIVPFAAQDASELAHFAVQAYSDIYNEGLSASEVAQKVQAEGFEEKIERDAAVDTILLAKMGSLIVGYIQFGDPSPEEDRPIPEGAKELRKLYVSPVMHGKGTGHLLMGAALEHPRFAQVPAVYLWVWGENPRATKFYEKYDFAESATREYRNERTGEPTFDRMMVRVQTDPTA